MSRSARAIRFIGIVASLVLSTAAATQATAADAPNGPMMAVERPTGTGWRVYASSVPAGARVSIIKGKKNANGSCTLSQSGSVEPGGLAVHSDEIAFNLTTCESQLADYELSNAEAVTADASGERGAAASHAASEAPTTPSSEGGSPPGPTALATFSEGAYSRTWYEDPPGLDVTSVRNSTNWSYNGSCVLSNTARANYSWLSGSGWSKQASNLAGGYTCARSKSSSYAKYRNGIFCLTIDTYNVYDRNNIYGQENGGYTWSYDATKSGGCTALLSIHHSAAFN